MKLSLAVLIALLLANAVGRADLLPPGTKNIPIEHRFETEKEYADWIFVVVQGSGGAKKVAFDPKTPLVIPGSSGVGNGPVPQPGQKQRTIPYRAAALFAVPKDTVKNLSLTEKELLAAVEDGKVAGMHQVNGHFFDHENAKATDARKSIVKRYKIAKIEAKGGVTLEPIKEDPARKEEEEQAAATPSFPWIATGLGAAAAIGFVGFLLIGRTRRV